MDTVAIQLQHMDGSVVDVQGLSDKVRSSSIIIRNGRYYTYGGWRGLPHAIVFNEVEQPYQLEEV